MTVEAPRYPEIRTLLEINCRAARDGRLADMVRLHLAERGRKPTPEETAWLDNLDADDAEARRNTRGAGRHADKRDALVAQLAADRAAGAIGDADLAQAVDHTGAKTALAQRYWWCDPRTLAAAAQIVLAKSSGQTVA